MARTSKPWLSLYDPAVPADFTPRFANGVALFEHGPHERPDDPGIYYFDTAISFADAASEAHAFAAALVADFGVRPGDRVALMLQNVPQMVNAVHAVWLVGGVVTPVNVMNKQRELRHQFVDADVRVAVCMEALHAVVDSVRATTPLEHVITVSELDGADDVPSVLAGGARVIGEGAVRWVDVVTARRGARMAPHHPAADDMAMLTYTSGTTGSPKGAINTHRAVVHNAEVWVRWFHLEPSDVTIAMAPLFHITGLIAHLAAARAALTPLLLFHRYDAGELLRLAEKWRGSYVIGPLTAFIALMDHPDFARRDLSSLTKVGSGGAPVSPAVAARFEEATGVYLHNTYGLTESTAPTHMVPMGSRAPVDPASGALSVGVPVPGADSRILSVEDGVTELAHGEIGEIVTCGPMVVPGYWNRPEESAEAIAGGWLHTGDVGLRDEQGWFWLVDRLKDVINASGFKVWPRDVEDVLYLHPAVVEAAVVGVPDGYRGETVRAYVTLRPGADVTPDEIIVHCRDNLAVYKAPRQVVVIDEMPKTATGKILRRELRDGTVQGGAAEAAR